MSQSPQKTETMPAVSPAATVAEEPAAEQAAPATWRWWAAVAAGAAVAVPLAWLLSFGASLPFMLGLFFFALFGLVIGAVMYRVGSSARPLPPVAVRVGAAIVVLLGWGLSLVKEARDFPRDMADFVQRRVQLLPEGMSPEDLNADVVRFVRQSLREQYGSSGVVGYGRWALASSRLEYPTATMKTPVVLAPAQHRLWWGMRVVLSLVLLAFGVYSQVGLLETPSDSRTGAARAAAAP